MKEKTLTQRSKLLLNGFLCWLAEDQLSLQTPILGNIPLLGDRLVDQWAVVLETASQSLGFK